MIFYEEINKILRTRVKNIHENKTNMDIEKEIKEKLLNLFIFKKYF